MAAIKKNGTDHLIANDMRILRRAFEAIEKATGATSANAEEMLTAAHEAGLDVLSPATHQNEKTKERLRNLRIHKANEEAGETPNQEENESVATKKGKKTNGAEKKTSPKAPKATRATKKEDGGKMSAIDAAAKVLEDVKGAAMNCKDMIEAMAARDYWTSPGGKTPAATLYSAILREISGKGKDARFKKADRGKFVLA